MKQRFAGHSSLRFFLGDVRDRERLMSAFKGIDIIIHAAALKQAVEAQGADASAALENAVKAKEAAD